MPADERYDVAHERNKATTETRYGCWGVPCRSEGYWAHPWAATGGKFVPFRMSHCCAYDLSANDPACEGCSKRKSL